MGSGLRFSLAGFPVSVPLNTLLGVALIAWLWLPTFDAATGTGRWLSAIIFAVVLLASILLHELAHAVAARRFGFPVEGITLWAFGGFTSYRPTRNTPGREAVIAASGPAATAVIAVVAWFVASRFTEPGTMAGQIVSAVAVANALVAVFNMLPGLPLDGGGVLSAGVWAATKSRAKGQRVAAYAGMVLAALIVAAPLLLIWRAGGAVDLGFLAVSILVAGFLFVGARSALGRADQVAAFEGRTAAHLAVPVVLVSGQASLGLLDAYLQQHQGAQPPQGVVALVGDETGRLLGYVLPAAAAAVPAAARAATPVGAVMRSVASWRSVASGAPAGLVADLLARTAEPVLVVDAGNQPVGVIISEPASG